MFDPRTDIFGDCPNYSNLYNKITELQELSKPIVNWLKENYDPYTTVIINDMQIRLTQDLMSVPFNNKEEE